MEYTFIEQSVAFLYSILLGAGLSLVYIPLKVIRVTLNPKKIIVIILDILFMLIAAFATFLYALAFLNGSVRFYMILGEAIGFLLIVLTVGKVILKISVPVNKFLIINIKKISNLLKKIIKKLLKILSKVVYNVGGKIYKFVGFFKKHKIHKKDQKDIKPEKLKKGSKKSNNNGRKKEIRKKKGKNLAKKHKRGKTA